MAAKRKTFIASSNLGSKDTEPLKPKIDLEYTTESQIIKKMIVDYVTPKPFAGMNSFPAQIIDILKTEDEKKDFYLNKLSRISAPKDSTTTLKSFDVFRYKARILDLDFYKPPITLEKDKTVNALTTAITPANEEIIKNNILIDYIYNTEFLAKKDEVYNIGDIVRVSFDNPNTQDFGYIEEKLVDTPEEKDSRSDFSGPAVPYNVNSPPPPINMNGNVWAPLAPPGEDTIEKDAYARGQYIGKIRLKKVGPNKFLREDAAKDFLAMQQAAKSSGISLILSSGFRTMEQQVSLYNERYNPGYLPNVPVKDARKQNSKKTLPNGKEPPTTAYPGTSNHQSGIAFDLAIPIDGWNTNEYKWLSSNAPNFGFTNDEGKSVNEAWHWTYVKKGSPPVANNSSTGDKQEG